MKDSWDSPHERARGSLQRVVGDFAGERFFFCLMVVEIVAVVIHGIKNPTELLIRSTMLAQCRLCTQWLQFVMSVPSLKAGIRLRPS